MGEERTPFLVRCGACGHVWPAAWLPMAMSKAAKLLRAARCPMCASGKLFVAESEGQSK